ncbi:MAG TPA: HlyD family efflux transporter periplasmic adaptor subunit [Burkholderiales bacterium]|nr:HlyD family efflux transporter periplasmic adaptor subunit [Burkholderiales bacterium]
MVKFLGALFLALPLVAATVGCTRGEMRSYRGVTEGEIIRLSAPVAGNIASIDVSKGAAVTEGTRLFSMAGAEEISAHAQAARRLDEVERQKPSGHTAEQIDSLKAEVAETEWKLLLKSAAAPVDGVVTETLYAKGDWVPAGAPVLSILPVEKIKVSFEVPLSVAAHLQHGRGVTLLCAQCDGPVEATITYVAPLATPASAGDDSADLRYRVEARPVPSQAAMLKPGQAVTVNL